MNYRVKDELDKCIKCGICTANCPVAGASSSFAGPKHMGPELTRFRLDKGLELEEQIDYCCDCRNCELVCPSGVKVSLLNTYYKNEFTSKRKGLNLRGNMLGRPGLMARMSSVNPGFVNFMLDTGLVKGTMDRTLGIHHKRSFPAYSKSSFRRWFNSREGLKSEKKVVYFTGCTANYNEPEIAMAVVQILERNGYEVLIPEVGCCGLPLAANGYLDAAGKQAQENLHSLLPYIEAGYPVVASCTSCGLALKSEYQELYQLDGAVRLGAVTYDFSEFLRNLEEKGELDTSFQSLPLGVAYHTPCHLKAQGIGQPSLDILQLIPDLDVVEADEGCCGMSGSYGFKKEKYEISMTVGSKLFDRIRDLDPVFVTTDCGACAMQIHQATGKSILHPAVVISRAYKYKEEQNVG
jgi:glycerol-3-phosphate dehydrogenase subunit C